MTQLIDNGLNLFLCGDAHLLSPLSAIVERTGKCSFSLGVVEVEPKRRAHKL
jgi:hypothetical protein